MNDVGKDDPTDILDEPNGLSESGSDAEELARTPPWLKALAGSAAPATSPATTLNPGESLDGYEIRELIGRGGFGLVYRAYEPTEEREVAIKLLWNKVPTEEEPRFREAIIAAQLDHPNIVRFLHSGQHRGHRYLVFEHLVGETLESALRRDALSVSRALDAARLVADALAYAHCAQIIHGDLKPSNVYLCKDGRVKLLDLGLAKSLGDHALIPPPGGTAGFMAPEQGQGHGNTRSDVFSAGMLLYVSLGGEVSMTTTVNQRPILSPAAPLNLQALRLSRSLRVLLQRATAVDPALRPADGIAWAAALKRATQRSKVPFAFGAAFVVGGMLLGAYLVQPLSPLGARARPQEAAHPAPNDTTTEIKPISENTADPVPATAPSSNSDERAPQAAAPRSNQPAAETHATSPRQVASGTPKKSTPQRDTRETPAPASRPTATRVREKEPNQLRKDANPISVGSIINGSLGCCGDYDMFRLEIRAPMPKALKIQMTNISESGSVYFFLHNRDNANVGNTSSSPNHADFRTKLVFPNADDTLYYFGIGSPGSEGVEYEVTITATSE